MPANASSLDPYTTSAENKDITPNDKIKGLHEIVKATQVAMLTTRSAEGHFHSRAMTPTSPHSDTQLNFVFIANNASHKFDEIQNDSNVGVSFYDSKTTSWASVSGKAKVSQDRELVKKHWSSQVSAFFGDLNDGKHKGDENDPRVSLIEVIPDEIRYWVSTKGTLGKAVETNVSAMTGKIASLGELRTISTEEIQLTQGLHSK